VNLVAHFQGARTVVSVQAGVVLFNEGESGRNMYVLMEGTVSICVGGKVIEVAGPGSLLGEMALIDSSVRSATAITRSDCRVISMNSLQFDLLVRESPEFARHVMGVMADRLRRMNQKFKEMAFSNRQGREMSPDDRARQSADENMIYPV
jgi:CRP/FNR family transcriptional regulator, cyclic AMP receptor protein